MPASAINQGGTWQNHRAMQQPELGAERPPLLHLGLLKQNPLRDGHLTGAETFGQETQSALSNLAG